MILIYKIFMKHSKKIGLSFGLTSGLITTLGLMVGLNSGTNSKLVVIGGILSFIAIITIMVRLMTKEKPVNDDGYTKFVFDQK